MRTKINYQSAVLGSDLERRDSLLDINNQLRNIVPNRRLSA